MIETGQIWLVWDGNGIWLCRRRLHRGKFVWPREGGVVHTLDQGEIEATIEAVVPETAGEDLQKRKPVRRKTLPPELPREEYRHEPESCQCGQCGKGMVQIGK